MFDSVPMDLQPFIGVAGLALVFIFVASMIHKYRLWQAEKMAKVQGLLRGASHIEGAIDAIASTGLPRSVARFFKDERVQRYQGILALLPNYEGIEEHLRQLENSRAGEGADPGWASPEMENLQQLSSYTTGLTGLVSYLTVERFLGELSAADAKAMREQLRTLRAETKVGFHNSVALEAAEQGNWEKAQQEILGLIGYLKSKAPPNERGKAMYQEALELYQLLNHGKLPERPDEEAVAEKGGRRGVGI